MIVIWGQYWDILIGFYKFSLIIIYGVKTKLAKLLYTSLTETSNYDLDNKVRVTF